MAGEGAFRLHVPCSLPVTRSPEGGARADRVGIVSAGKLVAVGTPEELTSALGGDVISLGVSKEIGADMLAKRITEKTGLTASVVEGEVRLESREAYTLAARIAGDFPGEISSLRIARPTLEDVFVARTGRLFADEHLEPDSRPAPKKKRH